MKRIMLIAVVAGMLTGCGWRGHCVNSRSYKLGEEKTTAVGAPILQSGCFTRIREPQGLTRTLLKDEAKEDTDFSPQIDQEILYSGRNGNVLNLAYREYTENGYARQPFFQQLTYDVGGSNTIVFRDWTITVLDSNNEHIKFKVVKEPIRPETEPR